ncbi:MAG: hypothetical protein HUU10_10065 [Bacteroidetes bacterium]|nr:hypothetical protein [Bacteroidota bacterium]
MTAYFSLLILLLNLPDPLVWTRLESGQAFTLNPVKSEWIPLKEREQLPAQSIILTKPGTRLYVYEGTETSEAPANAYFILGDVLPKTTPDLVRTLTHIELSQLPAAPATQEQTPPKPGITYGELKKQAEAPAIPFYLERLTAIDWFAAHGQPGGALLSLKRLVTRYPDLLERADLAERLFTLYDQLGLDGYLYDETSRLMLRQTRGDTDPLLRQWNERARQKLTRSAQPR